MGLICGELSLNRTSSCHSKMSAGIGRSLGSMGKNSAWSTAHALLLKSLRILIGCISGSWMRPGGAAAPGCRTAAGFVAG